MAGGAPARAWAGVDETAVKATYLYKFAPFIEWPASTFASPTSPLHICVLGDDAFAGVLEQAAMGQRLDGRPIMVRRLRTADKPTGCHILYLGAGAAKSSGNLLRVLKGSPILTVSDRGGDGQGAIIQFLVKDGRVRFGVDLAAANANGVTISSKLLSLAVLVKPGA